MKLVYICSPYRAATQEEMRENLQAALGACEEAYRLGRLTGERIIPLTPLVNFPYLDEINPEERDEALKMGLPLLSKCDEVWCAGERVSEGMRGEIRAAVRMGKPVYSMSMERDKIEAVLFDMLPMLDEKCCFTGSDRENYSGQLLVLKESELAPWALEPENQLWIANHGFGVSPHARGRAVYAKNLFDGEEARFDRSCFYGIADPDRLPDWAREQLSRMQDQNNDESEEIEP